MKCPKCGATAVKYGFYISRKQKIQRYRCKNCGLFKTGGNPLFDGLHRTPDQIINIIGQFIEARRINSFRSACEVINIKRATIIRWLKKFSKCWDKYEHWFYKNTKFTEEDMKNLNEYIEPYRSK